MTNRGQKRGQRTAICHFSLVICSLRCPQRRRMKFRYDLARFIPYRDMAVCERVRGIPREQITQHRNPAFKIRVIDTPAEFYLGFALDIVRRIRESLEAGQRLVAIFPVGRMPVREASAGAGTLHSGKRTWDWSLGRIWRLTRKRARAA